MLFRCERDTMTKATKKRKHLFGDWFTVSEGYSMTYYGQDYDSRQAGKQGIGTVAKIFFIDIY